MDYRKKGPLILTSLLEDLAQAILEPLAQLPTELCSFAHPGLRVPPRRRVGRAALLLQPPGVCRGHTGFGWMMRLKSERT